MLRVNGKDVNFDGVTVGDLLASYRLAGGPVVVELNGEVVHRQEHAITRLAEGDSIEIVRIVGGG